MNKTNLIFAAIISAAASVAAAKGMPDIKWNHANDAGPIAALQPVEYSGVKPAAKDDDRVKFTVAATASNQNSGYRLLGRSENR